MYLMSNLNKSLKKCLFFFLKYKCLPECMHVNLVCAWYPYGPEEGVKPSGTMEPALQFLSRS